MKKDLIEIYSCKNQYNVTIKQLKVDFANKTYRVGHFKINSDEIITKKEFERRIDLLKSADFKEIK